jgi:hypothetical protein
MKLISKTRLKLENSFLTLRRQLPVRDAEYYHPGWWNYTSLLWDNPHIELYLRNDSEMVFFMLDVTGIKNLTAEARVHSRVGIRFILILK